MLYKYFIHKNTFFLHTHAYVYI